MAANERHGPKLRKNSAHMVDWNGKSLIQSKGLTTNPDGLWDGCDNFSIFRKELFGKS
jgi:hypothetical protein